MKKAFHNDNTLNEFTRNINLSRLTTSLKLVKTIFGDISESNVTFCFDHSGSMYRVFHHFREHLLEALFKMLISNKGQKFNIVLFNSSVHQFSSKHVECMQENIINVIKWMNKPYYESKSNMLDGIIKAFDDYPDVVYLVTDGFINKDRTRLLSHLPHITKGRPIRCIMVTHQIPPDDIALDFLEDIVNITQGSLSVVLVKDFGAVEVVMPIIYSARPAGGRRSHFNPFEDETIDIAEIRKYFDSKGCHIHELTKKGILGDPMDDLPVIAPFVNKDPISRKRCPFYHPFFHWYWPQFWEGNGPSPTLMWTKNDPQYHSMWSDFRDSRAFICGQKYLETHNDTINSVSAGILLLNRKVLAFNYSEDYNIYLGKVLQQLSSKYFLVQFDAYKKYNETQRCDINEMIDFEEQKRYSIKKDDFVIAPLNNSDGAYEISKVLEGVESRFEYTNLLPVKNSNLKVKFLQSNIEKYIEFNQAIFISNALKEKMERLQMMCKTKNKNKSLSSEQHEDKDSIGKETLGTNNNALDLQNPKVIKGNYCCNYDICLCKTCYGPYFKRPLFGRVASPVDNGKAKTLEEIDREILEKKNKSQECDNKNSKVTFAEDFEKSKVEDTSDDDETECENISCETRNDNKVEFDSDEEDCVCHKKENKDAFTETDLNWCILRLLNRQQKTNSNKIDERRWRYWGKKPIPDVIDPPSTEPYKDPENWGGCPMPKPVANSVEWPNSTFQTINPHTVTNYSPNQMYEAFHHQYHTPSQRPKRSVSVGTSRISPEERCQFIYEKKFKYMQGGYPQLEMKRPNKDSIQPLLCSISRRNPYKSNESIGQLSKAIQNCRIDAQIQRDEMNCLNYLHHKTNS